MKKDKTWTKKRLVKIRKENQISGNKSPNGIERLYQEVVDIPELNFTGKRIKENLLILDNGSRRYPDFQFSNQSNKVIEVMGTRFHSPEEIQKIEESYSSSRINVLIFWEPEIVNDPQETRNKTVNFHGRCPNCGSNLNSLGTEPPQCDRCGKI